MPFFLACFFHIAFKQINYILGKNPMKMSYLVGYGTKFPKHVHHRGASIPNDNKKYSCTGGWKWRDSRNPNPHNITGAMVGGPIRTDNFQDIRTNYNYTEPTLAGNAGLVAALVSLTGSGGMSIDKNTIFSAVPPFYPPSPPPPAPWKPWDASYCLMMFIAGDVHYIQTPWSCGLQPLGCTKTINMFNLVGLGV